MKCIQCEKNELIKPQRKFCSRQCKQNHFAKSHYDKVKLINPNTSYSQLKGYLNRKLEAIDNKGGCCSKCGYKKNISALQFHHINPELKSFPLDARAFGNLSSEKLLKELDKCIVLCGNCHSELHHPDNDIDMIRKFVKNTTNKSLIPKVSKGKTCKICLVPTDSKKTGLCDKCYKESGLKNIYQRPDKEVLIQSYKDNDKNMSSLSRIFGCSDNAIRKWFKTYGVDHKIL